jgi:DNA-binding beta-propeller fold protein YncE
MKIVKKYWRVASLLLALTLLLFLFPASQHAYADGGAPNLAYVAGAAHGISVIDIGQQNVTGNFTMGGAPQTIFLSLDGRFLYVTQPDLGRVSMLAAKTGQALCSANVPGQPSLLAFDPGMNLLYAAGNGSASVTALDPNNCAIKQTIKMNGFVYGLAVAIIGSGAPGDAVNQLWVADSTALHVFDHNKLLASLPIPGGPQYISIPPGFTAYVTTRQGSVYAVDLNTRKLSPPLLSGGSFGPMDYNAFTSEVYIPDMQHKLVDVLSPIFPGTNALPHEPNYTIHLGVAPQSIAITSDGQLGFIALEGGNVAMLDIPGKQIVNTILVGGHPRFIITGLYPPLIGTTPQEASIWGTVINVAAYVLVIALLIVPIVLFQRYARSKVKVDHKGSDKA